MLNDLVIERSEGIARMAHIVDRPALFARGIEMGEIQLLVRRAESGEQVERVVQNPVRIGVRPVDLVQDQNGAKAELEGLAEHELGLGHNALFGIHQQQAAIHHAKDTLHLAAEVGVAGGVDDVDAGLTRRAIPKDTGALGQNGNAALTLLVVGVHGPLNGCFVGSEYPRLRQKLVDQRGFAVVNVRDDGDVTHGLGGRGHGLGTDFVRVRKETGARLVRDCGQQSHPDRIETR